MKSKCVTLKLQRSLMNSSLEWFIISRISASTFWNCFSTFCRYMGLGTNEVRGKVHDINYQTCALQFVRRHVGCDVKCRQNTTDLCRVRARLISAWEVYQTRSWLFYVSATHKVLPDTIHDTAALFSTRALSDNSKFKYKVRTAAGGATNRNTAEAQKIAF